MLLSPELLGALETKAMPACVLDRHGLVQWVNARWDASAQEDAAPPSLLRTHIEGTRWLDAIHGELHGFYANLLDRLLDLREAERCVGFVHEGQNNTPELFRSVRMQFMPLYAAARERPSAVLVVYRTLLVCPIQQRYSRVEVRFEAYLNARGALLQCGSCRRIKHRRQRKWDFVPRFVAEPDPRAQQGLCPACEENYYNLSEPPRATGTR